MSQWSDMSLLTCAGALPTQGSSRSYIGASLWERGGGHALGTLRLSIGPCPWEAVC